MNRMHQLQLALVEGAVLKKQRVEGRFLEKRGLGLHVVSGKTIYFLGEEKISHDEFLSLRKYARSLKQKKETASVLSLVKLTEKFDYKPKDITEATQLLRAKWGGK